MTTLASETWPGANGSPWPVQWTTTGGCTQQGGAGQIVTPSGYSAGTNAWLSGMADVVDSDLLVEHFVQNPIVEQYLVDGVRTKGTWSGSAPDFGYWIEHDPSGLLNGFPGFFVRRAAGAGAATLGHYAHTYVAGTPFWARLHVEGAHIQARVWDQGVTEPGTWDHDAVDATPFLAGGKVALTGQSGGGASATTCSFDGLVVTDIAATTGQPTAARAGTVPFMGIGATALRRRS